MKTFFLIIGGLAAFGLFCVALSCFQHWLGKRRWAKLSVGERLSELWTRESRRHLKSSRTPEPPAEEKPWPKGACPAPWCSESTPPLRWRLPDRRRGERRKGRECRVGFYGQVRWYRPDWSAEMIGTPCRRLGKDRRKP